ncbi:DUF3833 domain-containing protein [Massilia soli]|uniref:DUF3833 domain-containing protein n=1 Tax=Massilia soli TaxID=2792854 RepID=A0ABS7SSB0_9BURK|nr:DUF3833 domain-containing protein [Massilia soli]MBZ2208839.1 DUF3833 domain-containing protein [Massilia soli]
MRISTALIAAAAVVTLSACTAPQPSQYANEKPALDVQTYFNGTLDAHGMFQDRFGKVVKRFVVVMRCTWVGDVGTLDEDFVYSDGTKQKRVWTLRKTSPTTFTATAPDVVGTAEGIVSGNSLRWRYVLSLPVGERIIDVHMDDWMFLIDDKVMLNRTAMSKFGVDLGNVTLSFSKRSP